MDSAATALINKILTEAGKRNCSHVHFSVGSRPLLRIDDQLVELQETPAIDESIIPALAKEWLDETQYSELETRKVIIVAKNIGKQFRVKASFFYQKGILSATIALIPLKIPPLAGLGLPRSVLSLPEKHDGLIVVCGPFGSGRTTTMAALLEEINKSRKENIMVVERPIEYLFFNNHSLVTQREVPRDSNTFLEAVRYAEQSDVDVLAVGEEDEKGVAEAMVAFANSGRLAVLVMDASSAIHALETIVSRFSEADVRAGQIMLSETLRAVIVQRLVAKTGGGIALAAEVLVASDAVKSLVAEGKFHQLTTIIQSSRDEGMISLDQSLAELVKSGDVLIERAVELAHDPENFRKIAIR